MDVRARKCLRSRQQVLDRDKFEGRTYLLSKYEIDKGAFGSRNVGDVENVASGVSDDDDIAFDRYVPIVEQVFVSRGKGGVRGRENGVLVW